MIFLLYKPFSCQLNAELSIIVEKIYHLFSDSQKIMEKLVENCLGNGIHKLLAQYHTLLIDVLSRVVT